MESPSVAPETFFKDLGLIEPIQRALDEKGYEKPTPIQAKAIPVVLEGRDLIGSAQTGTGKTAAFALPTLQLLKEHQGCRCLVLEPTRELAAQVYEAFTLYGKHMDLQVALLHGGVGYGQQRQQLKDNADIIIATPGRLLDHLGQRTARLDKLEILILDEVDRMLDMGFLPDVRRIVGQCPEKRQTLLFSATIPTEIERLAGWVLKDPVQVSVTTRISTADTVTHYMLPVDIRQKQALLARLLSETDYHSVIIFSRTKAGADSIARWLEKEDHSVGVLHADKRQSEREKTLAAFRANEVEVLVATDIVARGIDIRGVSHVINYDIPENPEDYVHRIGRTGRASAEGDAYTLYTAGEQDRLRDIERLLGMEIPRVKLKGFDYNWTPVLEEKRQGPARRNRGFSTSPFGGGKKKKRR